MEHQCSRLQQLNWTLVDANNGHIARGSAAKNKKMGGKKSRPPRPPRRRKSPSRQPRLPPEEKAEKLSPAADRTPWQEFTLQGGCRLRTFWQGKTPPPYSSPPLNPVVAKKGGWLSGRTVITQSVNGKEKQSTVTFVHGFPRSRVSMPPLTPINF